MGAERRIPLDGVILSQEFPDLGVRIVQVAEDHSLAVAAGFNAGWQFADPDSLGAKVTFFDDTAGAPWKIGIQHFDKLFRIAPIEAPAAVRTGGHTETAANAAVIIHDDDTVFIAKGRLGRASPHAGRAVAMIAKNRHLKIFGLLRQI